MLISADAGTIHYNDDGDGDDDDNDYSDATDSSVSTMPKIYYVSHVEILHQI